MEFSKNNREETASHTKAKVEFRSNSEEASKPLEKWTPEDFPLVGCIYCINNGDYSGPIPLSSEDYERHIVRKHAGKPAYPGPADIKLLLSNS